MRDQTQTLSLDRRTWLRAAGAGLAGLTVGVARAAQSAGRAQADAVPDRLHDLALLRFPLQRALTGIKAAGYQYVAWGTTHREETGAAPVPVIAADAPPDRAKELGQKLPRPGPGAVMMFSGIYPEATDALTS